MTSYRYGIGAAAALVALAAAVLPAGAQRTAYEWGLGDLMVVLVQPRHAKLGLAGNERNWPYAAFALHELEESLEKIGKAVPKVGDASLPDLLASTVNQPLSALDRAIKAEDPAGFATAYKQLTDACNACHQSTGHAIIVIQAPATSAFPNQDFRPPRQ